MTDLRQAARALGGGDAAYDELVAMAGEARCVLIGEASHGTREFYAQRAMITRRLIDEHGFAAVAAEADWPDAHRVNCYVRGAADDADGREALGDFARFPRWMWRNAEVLEFVEWLRARNGAAPGREAGFYGLDLYSMSASIEKVLAYLDAVDPDAASRARERYACFEHVAGDPQRYGRETVFGSAEPCEHAAVSQLLELRERAAELARRDGRLPEDSHFHAEQNARLVAGAERYYRAMFRGRAESWNLRDRHMADTLDALFGHLARDRSEPRIVVWAHNSHVGDARATELGQRSGELNLGQLARERYGAGAFLIGFTTHRGAVTAASSWDAPGERMAVRPALEHSYESLLHDVGMPAFLVLLRDAGDAVEPLRLPRLERAIGVIYRPHSERASHYFDADLTDQFDAVVHLDRTTAVEPLEPEPGWRRDELPETYPSAV